MSSSPTELRPAQAQGITITDDSLCVDMTDGRTVSVPLAWYPRLAHGSPAERSTWRLIGRGEGIHWPDLDEDISVDGLLAGRPSSDRRDRSSAGSSPDAWPAKPAVNPTAARGARKILLTR